MYGFHSETFARIKNLVVFEEFFIPKHLLSNGEIYFVPKKSGRLTVLSSVNVLISKKKNSSSSLASLARF